MVPGGVGRSIATGANLAGLGAVLADPAAHDAYLELCETLLRGHVQFDVLFEGDTRFLAYEPDTSAYAAALRPGQAVPDVLPGTIDAPTGLLVASYVRDDLGGQVVHVVNRRYDVDTDEIEAFGPFEVVVDAPPGFDPTLSLTWRAPGQADVAAAYTVEGERVRLSLPGVHVYGVAAFER